MSFIELYIINKKVVENIENKNALLKINKLKLLFYLYFHRFRQNKYIFFMLSEINIINQ